MKKDNIMLRTDVIRLSNLNVALRNDCAVAITVLRDPEFEQILHGVRLIASD